MSRTFLQMCLLTLFCLSAYAGSTDVKNDVKKTNQMVSLDLPVVGSPVAAESTSTSDYKIGVYYFPGWKANQVGSAYSVPWDNIKPYSEREPLSGWYVDGEDANTEQQLKWMADYGINYVVYDWYWSPNKRTYLENTLASYLSSTRAHRR